MNDSLKALDRALSFVREYNVALAPGTVLQTLLIVAEGDKRGGIGIADVAKHLGCDQSTVSRNVHLLSIYGKKKMPGLKLVETERDPTEPKKHLLRLTTKGRQFLQQLETSMSVDNKKNEEAA